MKIVIWLALLAAGPLYAGDTATVMGELDACVQKRTSQIPNAEWDRHLLGPADCFGHAGLELGDVGICNKVLSLPFEATPAHKRRKAMTAEERKTKALVGCVQTVSAQLGKSVSFCDPITVLEGKNTCYYWVATNLKDVKICDKIQLPKECESMTGNERFRCEMQSRKIPCQAAAGKK